MKQKEKEVILKAVADAIDTDKSFVVCINHTDGNTYGLSSNGNTKDILIMLMESLKNVVGKIGGGSLTDFLNSWALAESTHKE